MARECLGEEAQVAFVPTLREGRAGGRRDRDARSPRRHAAGAKLDWGAFFAGTGAKRVALPTYPFQRKRYWLASALSGGGGLGAGGQGAAEHPLLAMRRSRIPATAA